MVKSQGPVCHKAKLQGLDYHKAEPQKLVYNCTGPLVDDDKTVEYSASLAEKYISKG